MWMRQLRFSLVYMKYRNRSYINRLINEVVELRDVKYDVIIVGAGIAGTSMAYSLSKKEGKKVLLIERDLTEPNRIVGELLQPGGVRMLEKLGMGDCLNEIDAQKTTGYVIHNDELSDTVIVPYAKLQENLKDSNEIYGNAFHHGRFIQSLRRKCSQQKNIDVIEGNVTKLLYNEEMICYGVQYKTKEKEYEVKYVEEVSPLTIVCDGCFSKFRKDLLFNESTANSSFYGLVLYDCPQIKQFHAELVLSAIAPILIYQIGSNETRILIDIKKNRKNVKEYLESDVINILPEHLKKSFIHSLQSTELRSMPNSYLPPLQKSIDGVICIGDAFNMRHPITGGGMSVAFSDVYHLSKKLKEIDNFSQYQQLRRIKLEWLKERCSSHSFVVNVLANAIYDLFAAHNDDAMDLRNACFRYFQRGGDCVEGPVSLLAIVKPEPFLLLYHFFSVALGSGKEIWKNNWSNPLFATYRSFRTLFAANRIILPLIFRELRQQIF
ncbi:hypothetical protein SNEBB_005156 [Seison nebaliae]|nr:hypothetical protein SNEBB_005156 [Seison nebaliae]